jgi:hypothetical protein
MPHPTPRPASCGPVRPPVVGWVVEFEGCEVCGTARTVGVFVATVPSPVCIVRAVRNVELVEALVGTAVASLMYIGIVEGFAKGSSRSIIRFVGGMSFSKM